MKKTVVCGVAILLLAAGIITLVTAGSISRRQQQTQQLVGVSTLEVEEPKAETPPSWMSEYELTASSGRTFNSQELAGKVHVVSFFFSSCPSVCRMQNAKIQELERTYGKKDVRFVSISCDPQVDTPAVLQEYSRMFNADPQSWLFLTGTDLNYLKRVGAEVYQLPVDKQVHSEKLIVIDRQGQRRGQFHWNEVREIADMKNLLDKLLAENATSGNSDKSATSGNGVEDDGSGGSEGGEA